jgi:hypothetical protein
MYPEAEVTGFVDTMVIAFREVTMQVIHQYLWSGILAECLVLKVLRSYGYFPRILVCVYSYVNVLILEA